MKVAKPNLRSILGRIGVGLSDIRSAKLQSLLSLKNDEIVSRLEKGEKEFPFPIFNAPTLVLKAEEFELVDTEEKHAVLRAAEREARATSDDTCLTDCRTHHVVGLDGLGRVDKDGDGVRYFKTPTGGAKVVHPEHQEVELPPDTELCADQCREWDPFANDGMGEIRKLYD